MKSISVLKALAKRNLVNPTYTIIDDVLIEKKRFEENIQLRNNECLLLFFEPSVAFWVALSNLRLLIFENGFLLEINLDSIINKSFYNRKLGNMMIGSSSFIYDLIELEWLDENKVKSVKSIPIEVGSVYSFERVISFIVNN